VNDRLRLRVKRQSAWQKIPVSERFASVEISTRNPRCAGAQLAAQLEWATQHFNKLQFAIGDTLQIHNYIVLGHPYFGSQLSEPVARKICVEEGDVWLERNARIIELHLGKQAPTVRRWDELLEEDDVRHNLRQIEKLYSTDPRIFELVRQDVVGYVSRQHKMATLTDEQWCMLDRHVLEELAVYQYQAEFGNYVSLYPGTNQLLLRPKYLASTNLPDALKARHYVTFDIKSVEGPVGAAG
jgi:tRNA-dependent cyclodipeptide synthase